jgi:hypothetical protein
MPNEKILEKMGSRVFWAFYFIFLFPLLWFFIPFKTIQEQNDIPLSQLLLSTPTIINLIIILMSLLTGLFIIKKKGVALSYAVATMILTIIYILFSNSEYFNYPLFKKILSEESIALWLYIQLVGIYYFFRY